MKSFELTCTEETQYQLAINGIVIPEDVLEDLGVEFEDREGYIEHLDNNDKNSYAFREREVAKTLNEELILITRNSLGAQEMVHPHSQSFCEICEKIIKTSRGE